MAPLLLLSTVIGVSSVFARAPHLWSATGSLRTSRYEHTATLLPSGQVLVVGGEHCTSTCTILGSAELYNPRTRKWSRAGSQNMARYGQTATLLTNGQVLVAGGYGGACPPCDSLASAELYDPRTGKWHRTHSMTTSRAGQAATLLSTGKVLVIGGRHCAHSTCVTLTTAELYLPGSGKWSLTRHMPSQGCGDTATRLSNGRVLITCGNGGSELYDPRTGAWTSTGSMVTTRSGASAVLLHSGRVLVAGGCCGPAGILASAELYDPHTARWSVTGSMGTPRTGFTATLLRNGNVLVEGGCCSRSGILASAEVYSARTGRWSPAGEMTVPRQAQTATLLTDGAVLIAGGYNTSCPGCQSLSSTELYRPPAQS